MTFAKIISEAGLNPTDYPNASKIAVTVADRKLRNLEENELNFTSPIFSENPYSSYRFKNFLEKCEANPNLVFLQITLIDDAIIIRDDDVQPSIFHR